MDKTHARIVCLSFYDSSYSRGSVYLNSNIKIDSEFEFIQIENGLTKSIKSIRSIARNEDTLVTLFVVLSPSHVLVPILRLFWRGNIVLDAGWPLTDAAVSRKNGISGFINLIKSYLIDLASFSLSNQVFIESNQQSERVARIFHIPRKKISSLFTGFDEKNMTGPSEDVVELMDWKSDKPIVLFRGSMNPESGMDIISRMSHLPGSENFYLLVCTNTPIGKMDFSLRTKVLSRRLSTQELKHIYEISRVCIGQISEHKRLNYTIPHKAFEAGYFKKIYISSDTSGIRELYNSDQQVIYGKNITEEILLRMILDVLADSNKSLEYEKAIAERYIQVANQKLLSHAFFEKLGQIYPR